MTAVITITIMIASICLGGLINGWAERVIARHQRIKRRLAGRMSA